MNRQKNAQQLHAKGYNCCQAVALSFADVIGGDSKIIFKLCEGFGAGFGNRKGICGALSGAVMVAGAVTGDGNLEKPSTKQTTYQKSAQLYAQFEQACGSVICDEIKGTNSGTPLIGCDACICHAVALAEQLLEINDK